MPKVKTLKIEHMEINTTKPITILREIEKVLNKHAGKEWTFKFKVED